MKALLVAVALCLLSPAPEPARILFVGNSLTYQNDLPGMVSMLARRGKFAAKGGAAERRVQSVIVRRA